MTRRAGIYLRISQDRTGREAGVARQEPDCVALGGRLGWEIVDRYVDNDISAFSGKRRPGYERLKADLLAGRIDAIIVWHPDRLYRRSRDLLDLIDLLGETKPEVATCQAGTVDLSTPNGRLVAKIGADVAEHESEHKAERVKAWHRQRAEAGQPNGGLRPFGYCADRITIDEAEAEVIREGARRVLAGDESRFAIVTDWNRRGIPTVTGAAWSTTMLYRMLTSPRIAGYREHKSQLHPAVWAAILDAATWEALLAAFKLERVPRGRPATYLLSGLVRCGLCGTKMTGSRTGRGQRVYRCNGANSHANGCGKVARDANRVEEHVRAQVLRFVTGPELADAMQARPGTDAGDLVLAELAELERRLKRLKEEYSVEAMWTKDEFIAHRDELEQRIDGLSATYTAPAGDRWRLDRLPADLATWWEIAPTPDRRQLVGIVVEKILIQPSGRGGNRFRPELIEIAWRA